MKTLRNWLLKPMKKLVNLIRKYAANVLFDRGTVGIDGEGSVQNEYWGGNYSVEHVGADHEAANRGEEPGDCQGYFGQTDAEFIQDSKANQENLISFMTLPINKVKMPTAKFAMRQKISHVTGLECFVSDIHAMRVTQQQDGTTQMEPLEECVYVVSYLDKNGQLHQFKALESEFSE